MLRTVEERGVRFVQLWFTDVLGQPKSFDITPAELENALEEGMTFDGSAIDGFSRVQESDVLAKPDPKTLPAAALGRAATIRSARMFCDIVNLDGEPVRGRPPPGAASATSTRPASRASRSTWPPRWSSSTSATGDPSGPPEAARHRLLLRPDHRRSWPATCASDRPHPRGHGHPGRVLPARGRPQPARDRPALHRRPDHGRQRHDLPPGGQGDRRSSKASSPPSCPSRSSGVQGSGMHTHLSLFEGDTNAFHDPATRTGCPRWPGASSPACWSTPPRSPRSPTSGSTPTSASSPATRPRSTCPGPATTARPWCGCRSTKTGKQSTRPASSTARPIRPATPTWRSRCCWPPA